MKHVDLKLRVEDAEPILREAAREAALYGGWLDHITSRTFGSPAGSLETHDDARKRWTLKFLQSKRLVEAFGVEIEPTSEEETLTATPTYEGGKRRSVGMFTVVTGQTPNFKKMKPQYRREVHAEACRQAADRVVRRWHESMKVMA